MLPDTARPSSHWLFLCLLAFLLSTTHSYGALVVSRDGSAGGINATARLQVQETAANGSTSRDGSLFHSNISPNDTGVNETGFNALYERLKAAEPEFFPTEPTLTTPPTQKPTTPGKTIPPATVLVSFRRVRRDLSTPEDNSSHPECIESSSTLHDALGYALDGVEHCEDAGFRVSLINLGVFLLDHSFTLILIIVGMFLVATASILATFVPQKYQLGFLFLSTVGLALTMSGTLAYAFVTAAYESSLHPAWAWVLVVSINLLLFFRGVLQVVLAIRARSFWAVLPIFNMVITGPDLRSTPVFMPYRPKTIVGTHDKKQDKFTVSGRTSDSKSPPTALLVYTFYGSHKYIGTISGTSGDVRAIVYSSNNPYKPSGAIDPKRAKKDLTGFAKKADFDENEVVRLLDDTEDTVVFSTKGKSVV